jgi:hypothetical protein
MHLLSREERRPKAMTVIGAAGLAVVAARGLEELVRRHDAKVVADHERARKLAKKAKKKTKKAKKKLAKARPPLPAIVGDGHS